MFTALSLLFECARDREPMSPSRRQFRSRVASARSVLFACGFLCLLLVPGAPCAERGSDVDDGAVAGQNLDDDAPIIALTRDSLQLSLVLGRRFLLENQLPAGNFRYQYDFIERDLSLDDNAVRQAGALWGLTKLHAAFPSAETADAIDRGLYFWAMRTHAHAESRGAYPIYDARAELPDGSTGALALLTLALAESLADETYHPAEQRQIYQQMMDKYLRFLVSLRRADGLFASGYKMEDGAPVGAPSPYYDGETLLAIARIVRLQKRYELVPLVEAMATTMHEAYVTRAMALDPDSDLTKGYYQWGTMAYFELYSLPKEAKVANRERYSRWMIQLAHWMIDVHRTLSRTRNTGYAYEGIITAWEAARQSGDAVSQAKFGKVIEVGMAKLLSWQVGHPTAIPYITRNANEADRHISGGVLNHAEEPFLRIDVTQHQMNSVALALEYPYADPPLPPAVAPTPKGGK